MKDILLDETDDLAVTNTGDIILTDSVSQAVKIRLRWFLNEWKFNTDFGIPYYEEVLIKGGSDFRAEQLIREQILSVEGVIEVTSITISTNRAERTMTVTFEAKADNEYIREEVTIYA